MMIKNLLLKDLSFASTQYFETNFMRGHSTVEKLFGIVIRLKNMKTRKFLFLIGNRMIDVKSLRVS